MHARTIQKLKEIAGLWLNVNDESKIRLVRLPTTGVNEDDILKKQSQQLSGNVKPTQVITDESTIIPDEPVQVLVEVPVIVRHTLFTESEVKPIYIHDIISTDDFAKALQHYSTFRNKYMKVKYVYEQGFTQAENEEERAGKIFFSRDETAQAIQHRKIPFQLLTAVGEGKNFELVVTSSVARRLMTSLLLAIFLLLDSLIYCYLLP